MPRIRSILKLCNLELLCRFRSCPSSFTNSINLYVLHVAIYVILTHQSYPIGTFEVYPNPSA